MNYFSWVYHTLGIIKSSPFPIVNKFLFIKHYYWLPSKATVILCHRYLCWEKTSQSEDFKLKELLHHCITRGRWVWTYAYTQTYWTVVGTSLNYDTAIAHGEQIPSCKRILLIQIVVSFQSRCISEQLKLEQARLLCIFVLWLGSLCLIKCEAPL